MKFNELSQELQEFWTRGVDHSKFNEGWADNGGVVKFKGGFITQYFKHIFTNNYQSIFCPFDMVHYESYGLLSIDKIDYRFSMATPSECAEAGIDYVPFMGWRDIESVPKNVSVLTRTEDGVGIGTYERNLRQKQWMPLPFA
jgi:hypothetical protein